MTGNCKLHLMEWCALCSTDPLTSKLVKDIDSQAIPGYVATPFGGWPTNGEPAAPTVAAYAWTGYTSMTDAANEARGLEAAPVVEAPKVRVVRTVRPVRPARRVGFTGRKASTTANQFAGVDEMEELESERELALEMVNA